MKQSVPQTTFLLILLITAIFGSLVIFKTNSIKNPGQAPLSATNQNANVKFYTSKNLKISFKYPKNWYMDEKNYSILIASYNTKIGENRVPTFEEIKIFIDSYAGCHNALDENLIDPGCGEGGSAVTKNEIISKETRETPSGTFLRYIIQTPKNKLIYNFFQKDTKTLQISKSPDPSPFEKEFEDIINSLRFL